VKISAILLAAGLSNRMGKDKLLLKYLEKSLLQHSTDLLLEIPVFERILITTDTRSKTLILPPGICVYINDLPEEGQSRSIKIGVEAATGTHYLFLNADQPRLTPDDISLLLKSAKNNPEKIIYPVIDSAPCSPAIFPEYFRKDLLNLTGDDGGRIIRLANPGLCYEVEVLNPDNFIDIDDEKDYNLL